MAFSWQKFREIIASNKSRRTIFCHRVWEFGYFSATKILREIELSNLVILESQK